MSRELNRMLDDPRKGIQAARNPLARLYRKILMELAISNDDFNTKMRQYLDDPRNGIAMNGNVRSSERGNLIKEMSRPVMTWKSFIKCCRFLRPVNCTFSVKFEWQGGMFTNHHLNVKMITEEARLTGDDE